MSECKHEFVLQRIQDEFDGQNTPVGGTTQFFMKVAYSVCIQCGEVRSNRV